MRSLPDSCSRAVIQPFGSGFLVVQNKHCKLTINQRYMKLGLFMEQRRITDTDSKVDYKFRLDYVLILAKIFKS